MEWSRTKWNTNSVPLFGYFSIEWNKINIPFFGKWMEWNGMKNNIFIPNELVFSFVFSIPSSTRSIFNLVGVIKHLKENDLICNSTLMPLVTNIFGKTILFHIYLNESMLAKCRWSSKEKERKIHRMSWERLSKVDNKSWFGLQRD
jgi:hypothetical protein